MTSFVMSIYRHRTYDFGRASVVILASGIVPGDTGQSDRIYVNLGKIGD